MTLRKMQGARFITPLCLFVNILLFGKKLIKYFLEYKFMTVQDTDLKLHWWIAMTRSAEHKVHNISFSNCYCPFEKLYYKICSEHNSRTIKGIDLKIHRKIYGNDESLRH